MAISYTRQTVTTGTGATNLINNNFIAIQSALNKAISRDSSSPNAMLTSLDMNSNKIINLPIATSNTEPVTYAQFLAAQGDLLYTGVLDGSLVTFTPSGTGSVARNVQQELVSQAKTALQFGATADGVADDTAEVQAAINACIAAGGKKLIIPAGNYKITSSLQITVGTDINNLGFIIEGEAPHQTKLTYSGTGYCFVLGTGLPAGSCDAWSVTIKDLAIHGSGASPTGAIKFNGCYFCRVDNVAIRYFNNAGGRGIFMAGTGDIANYHNVISHTYVRDCATGIYMDNAVSGIGANSNFVRNSWFGGHSAYAIHINGGDTNVIEQNEFNGSTVNAIYIENDANDNKIIANQFDGPTVWVTIASAAVNNTLLSWNTGGGGGGQFGAEYLNSGTNTILYSSILSRITYSNGLSVGGLGNATNVTPFVVIAPAGLSTDSFRVNDSAGAYLLKLNQSGALEVKANLATHGKVTFKNDLISNSVVCEVNTDTTPGAVGLQLTADSLQTADMAQLQNEGGTVLWQMSPLGAQTFTEQTAPSAPSANKVVIYAEDNGGGKTRLMARFPTGAAQQIALEP